MRAIEAKYLVAQAPPKRSTELQRVRGQIQAEARLGYSRLTYEVISTHPESLAKELAELGYTVQVASRFLDIRWEGE
jgi:hypothetical protein